VTKLVFPSAVSKVPFIGGDFPAWLTYTGNDYPQDKDHLAKVTIVSAGLLLRTQKAGVLNIDAGSRLTACCIMVS